MFFLFFFCLYFDIKQYGSSWLLVCVLMLLLLLFVVVYGVDIDCVVVVVDGVDAVNVVDVVVIYRYMFASIIMACYHTALMRFHLMFTLLILSHIVLHTVASPCHCDIYIT